jgi:hypothetical protein
MLTLSVIGLLWLGCLVAFVTLASRAPTMEDMQDRPVELTDEIIVELRHLAARGSASSFAFDNLAFAGRQKAG